MSIDTERINRFLLEIKSRHREISALLAENTDEEVLQEIWRLKGLKYSLIEVAEAMANILQHILAKDMGEPVTGYAETIIRAGELRILPAELSKKLKPFFDFRNSLIHRYWVISDSKLLSLVRENIADFVDFIGAIQTYVSPKGIA
ncbi:MAG: hypothetical protein H6R38_195 [Deltaproteobacteria bacterium]|jgi:uncharacterized protein YutE (UPF0331/DUF86 family)|nr:hypothetical protein [Deltaproteobacteria bacterium]